MVSSQQLSHHLFLEEYLFSSNIVMASFRGFSTRMVYIMLEIHHSSWEPSNFALKCWCIDEMCSLEFDLISHYLHAFFFSVWLTGYIDLYV